MTPRKGGVDKGYRFGPREAGHTPTTTLGENVDRERREADLTYAELAELAGVSQTQIQGIVSGRIKNPGVYGLYGLAVALGTRMETLLGVPRVDHTTKGRSRARRDNGA